MVNDNLQKIYESRFSKTEKYRQDVWKVLCENYFQQYIAPTSTVLELGTGWGEFINNIRAANKLAMDLNPETKKRINQDITFFQQDCSEEWPVNKSFLDVVFTSNFLEHLPSKEKIEKTIDHAYQCLKKDGIIICLGPNIKYVNGAYWDFWDHCTPLTESSMVEVLKLKGFSIELCIPQFLPYTISQGSKPPIFFVSLYLKIPIAWKIFGKQFLVIGRKQST